MTKRSSAMASLALALAGAAWAAPAFAQSCGDDMQKLVAAPRSGDGDDQDDRQIRQGQSRSTRTVFCAKSGGLIAAENAMIAYMEKNKDWCRVPDEAIDNLKANHAKSAGIRPPRRARSRPN